jgi:ABC-type multidrug transport system fused ATPase/permease subunit
MDLAKATALCLRVSKLYEVMEAFLEYERAKDERAKGTSKGKETMNKGKGKGTGKGTIDESRKQQIVEVEQATSLLQTPVPQGPCCPYAIRKLPCGELVPTEKADSVVFQHIDVYTPDGLRLLLEDVSLALEKGDRCLIMGPSGIGKSSLLRVLGGLWPVFRTPNAKPARFCRPGPEQVFFLAQRPYLFEGTLRQNVAYPVWEQALLDDLSDDKMEELFRTANLMDVWNAHKHDLDKTGIAWADLLSLGEQQRLQFCRLFWHHDHVKKTKGPKKSFFAVLDESSASMDTNSEMCVYRACVERKVGILSVAHRPTVIQFHTKVLHFEFDNCHVLRHRVRPATIMARETAVLLTKHLRQPSKSSSGTAVAAASEAFPSRDSRRTSTPKLRKWTEQNEEFTSPRDGEELHTSSKDQRSALPMIPSDRPSTPVFAPL